QVSVPLVNVRIAKPVTGRPKNVTSLLVTVTVPGGRSMPIATWFEPARPLDARPVAEAPTPVKVSCAQPFWKPERTVTLVRSFEPSTEEVVVLTCVCASSLRIDRIVDSQHSEFGWPPGGVGENCVPPAAALCSSRLKNVKPIVSHAPLVVSLLVYGANAVVSVTNRFFSGWVRTQSVREAVALSRMYSFITAECMNTEATALAPPVGPPTVSANSVRYAVMSAEEGGVPVRSPARVTTLIGGLAASRRGVVKPESVYCSVT